MGVAVEVLGPCPHAITHTPLAQVASTHDSANFKITHRFEISMMLGLLKIGR